ncbi:MAG: cyclic nucleotide-binding domain-containing protein [Serpentinimonas sp.]|nr:cyclic nucleotide-binding domain-containing protein [Serpentinimonas sp.]
MPSSPDSTLPTPHRTDAARSDSAVRAQAAQLLIAPTALEALTLEEALTVVDYMAPLAIDAGVTIVYEGETDDGGFMLLVLAGEVTVESEPVQFDEDNLLVRVLGPGSLMGELSLLDGALSLLDGAPRSATCVASTDIFAAVLTRERFLELLRQDPRVGAKLLLAVSQRLADHLRATTHKLKLFAQMNKVLSAELARNSARR